MGQKVNPYGMRVGIIETWRSRWFARRDVARYIGEDLKIREYVKSKLQMAAISNLVICVENLDDFLVHMLRLHPCAVAISSPSSAPSFLHDNLYSS